MGTNTLLKVGERFAAAWTLAWAIVRVTVPPELLFGTLVLQERYIKASPCSIDEGETIMRTMSDCWVVCRKSGHRRFFVVLQQKSVNFAEINGMLQETLSCGVL